MPMSFDYKYVPLTNALCRYIRNTRTHTPVDEVLEELRSETRKLGRLAVMQVPEEQGEFLRLLVSILAVSKAFEAGTFTGYSSICIASGLSVGGRLITCDTNAKYGEIAHRYWAKLGIEDRITFAHQDALIYLRSQPKKRQFDFAFVDADRLHYVEYFKELISRVRANGVIIFDNMLAKGAIAEGTGKSVITRRRLNAYAAADSHVEAMVLPIGDGMLMCRVKE
jgi:caffeoyl-CoA O-methyltransferase